jgi:hypothetical protein
MAWGPRHKQQEAAGPVTKAVRPVHIGEKGHRPSFSWEMTNDRLATEPETLLRCCVSCGAHWPPAPIPSMPCPRPPAHREPGYRGLPSLPCYTTPPTPPAHTVAQCRREIHLIPSMGSERSYRDSPRFGSVPLSGTRGAGPVIFTLIAVSLVLLTPFTCSSPLLTAPSPHPWGRLAQTE